MTENGFSLAVEFCGVSYQRGYPLQFVSHLTILLSLFLNYLYKAPAPKRVERLSSLIKYLDWFRSYGHIFKTVCPQERRPVAGGEGDGQVLPDWSGTRHQRRGRRHHHTPSPSLPSPSLSVFTSPSPFHSPPLSSFSTHSHSPFHYPSHSPSLPSPSLSSVNSSFHSHSPSPSFSSCTCPSPSLPSPILSYFTSQSHFHFLLFLIFLLLPILLPILLLIILLYLLLLFLLLILLSILILLLFLLLLRILILLLSLCILLLLLLLLCLKVGDTNNLNLSCTVNGVVKQDSNTRQLVFGVAEVCVLKFWNSSEICKHVAGCFLGLPVHHTSAWGHHPHRSNSIGYSEVGRRDLV